METPRESLAAPAHHDVVVVLEDRPRDGRERIHPGLGGPHVPVVEDRRRAVLLEQAPVPRAGELADRLAAHRTGRVELLDGELELELVRDPAAPGDQVALVRREHSYALDATPPLRPPLGVPECLPDLFAGALQEPSGQKCIATPRGSPSRA